ncbi:GH21240 [Drosophila grimshawi]|uniref:GH21240 n=1 Tax=Drosophila grimshawi TaxID=7222 RepID=B4JRQ5_DROGR|nr:GH21240 [Drosophila grimshawi]
MDQFNVPRNINRQVFNAVVKIQSSECGFASVNEITKSVKKQLRSKKSKNNPRLNEIINESLHNMTRLGVLDCIGSQEHAIWHILKWYTPRITRLKINSKGREMSIKRLQGKGKRKSKLKQSLMEKGICRECHSLYSGLLKEYKSIELINPKLNETDTDC